MTGLSHGLREIVAGLLADRTRILFVALGVTWGTLGLSLLLASGSEMVEATGRTIDVGGADILRFYTGATSRPHEGLPAGRRIRLRDGDAALVQRAVPGLRGAALEHLVSGIQARVSGRPPTNVRVHGVDAAWCQLRGFVPDAGTGQGRVLNVRDVEEHRRVAMLGRDVARRLFGTVPVESMVGRRCTLRGQEFTVVGVRDALPPLGNYGGRDEEKVVVPSTVWRDLFGDRPASYLIVGLEDARASSAVQTDVRRVLGTRRGFDPADPAACGCADKIRVDGEVRGIVLGVRGLTFVVGLLGLLVALVGVGNAMFVMVDERSREFALLLALGARPATILWGRVVEALVITVAGGAAGVALAALSLAAFRQVPIGPEGRAYLGEPELSWTVATGTALLLGVAGGVAGYWPARRAAAVDPVEVLRDE